MSNSISTSSGNQAVDPYKSHNFEDVPLQQKVEDLVKFASEIKYGMLTTKLSEGSDLLASRCMALAGQVCTSTMRIAYWRDGKPVENEAKHDLLVLGKRWHRPHLPHKPLIRQSDGSHGPSHGSQHVLPGPHQRRLGFHLRHGPSHLQPGNRGEILLSDSEGLAR